MMYKMICVLIVGWLIAIFLAYLLKFVLNDKNSKLIFPEKGIFPELKKKREKRKEKEIKIIK